MNIDEKIKEVLQNFADQNEQYKDNRKQGKMLSKASKTWRRLTEDSLNNRLGEC